MTRIIHLEVFANAGMLHFELPCLVSDLDMPN